VIKNSVTVTLSEMPLKKPELNIWEPITPPKHIQTLAKGTNIKQDNMKNYNLQQNHEKFFKMGKLLMKY